MVQESVISTHLSNNPEEIRSSFVNAGNCCSDGNQQGHIAKTVSQPSAPSIELDSQSQKLLQDVLYSMESLMGKCGRWLLTEDIWRRPDARKNSGAGLSKLISDSEVVTMDQVLQILSEAFGVSDDTLQALREEAAKSRKPAKFFMNLTVLEADVQCQRDDAENTNCYIKIASGPVLKEEFVTHQIKGTIRPKWKHNMKMNLSNIFGDHIRIELWHTKEEEKKKRRHFIPGYQQGGPMDFLLAELTVPLKGTSDRGISGWYEMENRFGTNLTELTRVNLAGNISCIGDVELDSLESYESLLRHLVGRYIDGKTQEKGEKIRPCGDSGNSLDVPGGAKALLSQHATVLNLSYSTQLLSWWSNVTTAVSPVDWQLVLLQFREVKDSLVREVYSTEEQKCLQVTLYKVLEQCTWCIKNLEACFPVAFKERSKTQLTSMLQILRSIEDNPRMTSLLEGKFMPVRDVIKVALQGFSRRWCDEILDILNRSTERKDQLVAAASITEENNNILRQMVEFYDRIFASEFEVCCLKSAYPVIAEETINAIRPVIEDCCQAIPNTVQSEENEENFVSFLPSTVGVECDFLKGSHLMRIYKNIIKTLCLRCSHMTQAMVNTTGLHRYNDFFKDGIHNQLSLTTDREFYLLKDITTLDDLTVVGPQTPYSASLLEATAIPHRMKIWWVELVWVNSEESFVYWKRLLKELLFLGTTYCKLIEERIDYALQQKDDGSQQYINAKICVIIRNMNAMAKEMDRIPDIFGYKFHQEGDQKVEMQRDEEVKTLVQEAVLGVESISRDFISQVLAKQRGFLERSIATSCQGEEESSFLMNILYPTLDLLRKHLESNNIQQFLKGLWDNIVDAMRNILAERCLKSSDFYGKMHRLLRIIFADFTHDTDEALEVQSAESQEYKSLVEDLRLMEMSSSSLINHYYKARYQEQMSKSTLSSAKLDIRTLCREKDKLVVHVLMAKDIVVPPEEAHKVPLQYYVKIQILSPESNAVVESTSIVNSDPATYDEEFEFDLNGANDSAQEYFLQLTLKDHNKTRSNTFLGEAFVPLADILTADQSPQYLHLKMTMPRFDTGCRKILEVLQRRKNEKEVYAFLKKLKKRYPSASDISKSVASMLEVPLACAVPLS